jgi:hypothetical protein
MRKLGYTVFVLLIVLSAGCGKDGPTSQVPQNQVNLNAAQPNLPQMVFHCAGECYTGSRWFRGTRYWGKGIEAAFLKGTESTCEGWRAGKVKATARAFGRLNYCDFTWGTCSGALVLRQSNRARWQMPSIPAGDYVVCAYIDKDGSRTPSDEELYSETQVRVNGANWGVELNEAQSRFEFAE